MYTLAALGSLYGASVVFWLCLSFALGHVDFWHYDAGFGGALIFCAASCGTTLGACLGVRAARDTDQLTTNGGFLLYAIGFLGALIPVGIVAASGGPNLYQMLPIAGLCLAATATRSGLSPMLGLGLLGWLTLAHVLSYRLGWLNRELGYTVAVFVFIFLACGFLRSRVDWALTGYSRARNEPP